MTLPPLANLVAVHDRDLDRLAEIERRLERSREFHSVWQPTAEWVAATAPLPGGEPDPQVVSDHGFAFAEGRDNILGGDRRPSTSLHELAELVDSHPERLSHLPGDFSFIRFDDAGRATVVRSCGGLVPIYVSAAGGAVTIGTRLELVAELAPDEPSLDAFSTAVWLTGYCFLPWRRTPVEGVLLLPRGHYARDLGHRAVAFRSYWDPRPDSEHELIPTAEHSERLRTLLIDTLERDLHPDGNNLLTLSGGVDSSSLGSLAAGTLRKPVSTLTLLPALTTGRARELTFIDSLRSHVRFRQAWNIVLDPETKLNLLNEAPTGIFPVLHPLLWALPNVHKELEVKTYFGGEFGDEICGAYISLPDWVRHTPLLSLARSLKQLPMGSRDLLRWAKRRSLETLRRPMLPFVAETLPEWVKPELQAEYRDWRQEVRSRVSRDRRPLRYLTLSMDADGWLPMNWEVTSSLGIRRSNPFFTREILELAYECHPSELLGPGTKKLIRAALADDVPPLNLNRQDRGDWGVPPPMKQAWTTPLPVALTDVVRQDFFPQPQQPLPYWDRVNLTILVRFAGTLSAIRAKRREEPR